MTRDDILSRIDMPELVRATARNLMTHPGKGTLIGYEYGRHIGAADPDDVEGRGPDGRPSEDLVKFGLLRARELIEEKIDLLASTIDENDGVINLFRGLVVDPGWLEADITKRAAGLCWSWDYDFAIPYNPEGSGEAVEVRLCALLEVDDVDWSTTILLNASELYNVGEEREVRLKPTAMVEIFGVDWRPFEHFSSEPFKPHERFEGQGIWVCAGEPAPLAKGTASGMSCFA